MKLLVNAPTGLQEVVEVAESGSYFDESLVIWDERADGELPSVTLGGMVRNGSVLEFSQAVYDASPEANPVITEDDRKMAGVLILGVMCSATKNDQNGLTAVALGVTLARGAATTFPDTVFYFENGNSLVVTDANFDTIYAAWTPFRQSFFAVPA